MKLLKLTKLIETFYKRRNRNRN